MRFKNIALAVATGTTLLAAAPAFADPPHWAPAHGWHAKHRHRYYQLPPRFVVVPPAPYYSYPPPPIPAWQVRIGLRL